ncbi:predicted protein, partial [Nematostella vectensis]
LNEEFLVSAYHQYALIASLLFVHTARRYYRWNEKVNLTDWEYYGKFEKLTEPSCL